MWLSNYCAYKLMLVCWRVDGDVYPVNSLQLHGSFKTSQQRWSCSQAEYEDIIRCSYSIFFQVPIFSGCACLACCIFAFIISQLRCKPLTISKKQQKLTGWFLKSVVKFSSQKMKKVLAQKWDNGFFIQILACLRVRCAVFGAYWHKWMYPNLTVYCSAANLVTSCHILLTGQ